MWPAPKPSKATRLMSVTEELVRYIEQTTVDDDFHVRARNDAREFGLSAPDISSGQLLSLLAALVATNSNRSGVAATPAAGIVGLYLFDGLGPDGHLTFIDPEHEHQNQAKDVFRAAGHSHYRFLPSRPLEVMGRLAPDSYRIVVGDVPALDLPTFIDEAWPLLQSGGVLVLLDALFDGLLGDETRTDREFVSAREADEKLRSFEDALITRLPLGAGAIIAFKK